MYREEELNKKRDPDDPCVKIIKEVLNHFRNLPKNYFEKLIDEASKKCKAKALG